MTTHYMPQTTARKKPITMQRVLATCVTLLLVSVVACGGEADNESSPDAAESLDPEVKLKPFGSPRAVEVGVVGAYSDAPLYLALERGYFEQYGLEVELSTFANSGEMVAPLGSDQIDVGGGAVAPGLWNAVARGIDVRAFADKGSNSEDFSYSGFILAPGSPIDSCGDLEGARIGISATSNGVLHSQEIFLNSCDLSLEDVETEVLGFSEMAAAVDQGSVDAAYSIEPSMTIAEAEGLAEIWLREGEIREGGSQQAILLASPAFRSDRALASRFAVAYALGVRDYRAAVIESEGPTPEEFIDVLVENTSLQDRALYDEVVPAFMAENGELNLDSMRSDFEWFKERGDIEADDVEFSDAVDTSYVEFAEAYLEEFPDG